MGYRIDYEGYKETKASRKKEENHIVAWTFVCSMVFLLLVNYFWPEGRQMLRQLFLPGDGEAVQAFAVQLQQGESLEQAVRELCRTVCGEASR